MLKITRAVAAVGKMNKTIGVIGAGAGGLCAARHIAARGMVPIVWEQSNKVGGTWVYNPSTGKDEHGLPIHSSMYENLKTNLPKEIMGFPDFPFKEEESSFVKHTSVLRYLQEYTDHFSIHQYIKFNHYVEKVVPVLKEDGPPAWNVTVKDLDTQEVTTTLCDALYVCNGHYSVPKTPDIPGIENYKGGQSHSHNYRTPDCFKDMRVVVLGASASGMDISLEVSTVAKEVILSHNHPVPIPSKLPSNLRQMRGAVEATEKGFIMADGEKYEADAIIYCTGYEYTFPFLDESCGISVKNNQVIPLYKHLINSTYPSMAFIGIPFQICPFPMFDIQVSFFCKVLCGEIRLPGRDEMEADTKEELNNKLDSGIPLRHFHKMGEQQWIYNKELVKMGNLRGLAPAVENLYQEIHMLRRKSVMTYKTSSYRITGFETFERVM